LFSRNWVWPFILRTLRYDEPTFSPPNPPKNPLAAQLSAQFFHGYPPSPVLDVEGVASTKIHSFGPLKYFLRADRPDRQRTVVRLLRGHFDVGTISLSRPALIRSSQTSRALRIWKAGCRYSEGSIAAIPAGEAHAPRERPESQRRMKLFMKSSTSLANVSEEGDWRARRLFQQALEKIPKFVDAPSRRASKPR